MVYVPYINLRHCNTHCNNTLHYTLQHTWCMCRISTYGTATRTATAYYITLLQHTWCMCRISTYGTATHTATTYYITHYNTHGVCVVYQPTALQHTLQQHTKLHITTQMVYVSYINRRHCNTHCNNILHCTLQHTWCMCRVSTYGTATHTATACYITHYNTHGVCVVYQPTALQHTLQQHTTLHITTHMVYVSSLWYHSWPQTTWREEDRIWDTPTYSYGNKFVVC